MTIDHSKFFAEDFKSECIVTEGAMNIGVIEQEPFVCEDGHVHENLKVFIINFSSLSIPPLLVPCDSPLGQALLGGYVTDLARELLDTIESLGV